MGNRTLRCVDCSSLGTCSLYSFLGKATYKKRWRYPRDQLDWGGQVSMNHCNLPLILKGFQKVGSDLPHPAACGCGFAQARRTWATAKLAPQLLVHLEWWRAYYSGWLGEDESKVEARIAAADEIDAAGQFIQHQLQQGPARFRGRMHASFERFESEMPSSRATCAIGFPLVWINCTASRLNSGV